MSICNNCDYNDKENNLCTQGKWQSNTKDMQAPLGECDYKSKAAKVKRNEA